MHFTFLRTLGVIISLLLLWQAIIWIAQLPDYILPGPYQVIKALITLFPVMAKQSIYTISESIIGLILATLLGCTAALSMAFFYYLRHWLKPILLISQALPTFAIAPLFVIWFGYGMASKIATTILMLFFPITSAFFDGLRRTNPGWLDLAQTMDATRSRTILFIRIPAALPQLATGLRVAAAAAPIGAVIGEWVGSSNGLGYLILNANSRMQIDVMFAVLMVLIAFNILLYFVIDKLLRVFIPWQYENLQR